MPGKSKSKGKVIPFKKKKKSHKKFYFFVLIIASIVTILLYAPIFNVQTVDVIGNTKYSQEDIFNASGILIGQNIFKNNYFKSRDNILLQPYVEGVKIKRSYPNKIIIDIMERKPAIYSDFVGRYLLMDKDGIALELVDDVNTLSIPYITGLQFSAETFGHGIKVNEDEQYKLEALKTMIKNMMNKNIYDSVRKMDFSDAYKFIVWTKDDIFEIHFLYDDDLNYKINFVRKIMEEEKDIRYKYIIDATMAEPIGTAKY